MTPAETGALLSELVARLGVDEEQASRALRFAKQEADAAELPEGTLRDGVVRLRAHSLCMNGKPCTGAVCDGAVRPLVDFYPLARGSSVRQSQCITCGNASRVVRFKRSMKRGAFVRVPGRASR